MKKWGIGIEHEMRIRFNTNLSELPKDIYDKYFNNVSSQYLFIDSEILLYYFDLYEVNLMINSQQYIKNNDTDIYFDKLKMKKEISILAKNKIDFPLKDKKFFDLENKKELSIEFLNYYILIYTLYNAPLLFFTYSTNNINFSIKELIDNNNISESLDDKLTYLYNGTYEKKIYNYLQNNSKNSYTIQYSYNTIKIIFLNNKNNKNNKYNTNNTYLLKFINNLDLYIKNIREIFDNELIVDDIGYDKFYKNLYTLYNNKIPHIDSTKNTNSIEFKTIHYENMNYEDVLNNLIDLEQTFFYTINNFPIFKKLKDTFGEFIYHNIGSAKNTISVYDIFNFNYYKIPEDYTGSYHIWITLPYSNSDRDETSMKKFIENHVNLANKLQLLEPILAAHYTSPSYNSLDNNVSKSSLRQFINPFANYGTSDITLLYGAKKHFVEYYFLSEEDIYNNVPFMPSGKKYEIQIYNNNGKNILNYNKLSSRIITNNIFMPIESGNIESDMNINIQNYFTKVFEKTKIKPIMNNNNDHTIHENALFLELGADIRSKKLNEYFYPLDKEWERCFLMKKNKLIEVYYNKDLQQISYERVYDKEVHKKKLSQRVGIEFRILDHFPTKYLDQLLGVLVPIVLDSCKDIKKIQFKNTYVAKQFWHDEMFNIITNGYEYVPGIKYLNALEKEFNIVFDNKKNVNTETILRELYIKMSKNHKSHTYNKMKFHSKINFINFNRKAWHEIIQYFFTAHPDLLKKITFLNKNSKNNNILDILERKYNRDLSKIKDYLENLEK
jgi:hypothetical protein